MIETFITAVMALPVASARTRHLRELPVPLNAALFLPGTTHELSTGALALRQAHDNTTEKCPTREHVDPQHTSLIVCTWEVQNVYGILGAERLPLRWARASLRVGDSTAPLRMSVGR